MGAQLSGKLHCMADQCVHAPVCPLNSRRGDVDPDFEAVVHVMPGGSYICTTYRSPAPFSENRPAERPS